MKILKTIREEIVPLSNKQNVILLIIVACLFQFVLFYTPALAETSVANATSSNSDLIVTDQLSKSAISADTTINQATTDSLGDTSDTDQPTDSQASSTIKVISSTTHTITAYNSDVAQTDDDPCTTANGFNLCQHNQEDTVAANFLKFGTKIRIPDLFGDKIFVVRDRMNKKHNSRLDVWMKNRQEAMNFGIKVAKIEVLE
jgi:3D (Asp-Asp-Asp) domain-containing protein